MKVIYSVFVVVLLAAFTACNSPEKDMAKIKSLESTVFKDKSGMNKGQAEELVKLYDEFAKKYPKDSAAVVCLYKAAEMSINLNKGMDAIGYFDRVIKEYPDYKHVPDAYFLKGFVYEISIMNIDKARQCYEEFLKKYPTHELAKDAEASLHNLGKTPEQVLLEAKQMNEQRVADSLAAVKK